MLVVSFRLRIVSIVFRPILLLLLVTKGYMSLLLLIIATRSIIIIIMSPTYIIDGIRGVESIFVASKSMSLS